MRLCGLGFLLSVFFWFLVSLGLHSNCKFNCIKRIGKIIVMIAHSPLECRSAVYIELRLE